MALIEIRGLTKLYRMGDSVVHALDGVDLTIERGEFLAITGASGSGKSTMMHLLGCLDRPTGGIYRLDGRDVNEMSDQELAAARNKQIGFVFQTFNLINRTAAWENVAVPLFYARKTNTRGPAMRALERVGLSHRAAHQPNELSGGERQRVAIARAIVNDPLLLMADEPTGNLDSRTGEQIMEIFRGLNAQGVTIVMVTHEPDIAEQTRRIVQMRDGKIVSDRLTKDIISEEGHPTPKKRLSTELAEPAAAEEAEPAKPAVVLTPRLVRGATAGFVCGLIGAALWVLGIATEVVLSMSYDMQAIQAAKKMPPVPLVAGGFAAFLAFVIGLVLAILAIVFSRGARKRMRTEPGNWQGGRRALTGLILGWLTVAIPVVGVIVSLIRLAT